MARKKTFFDGQPKLFTPSKIRGLSEGTNPILNYAAGINTGSVQSASASFRYDPPGSPIKSTQQIPIDWSKFENHTFFNSAAAKTQISFEKVINQFPFDGSKKDLIVYRDRINGYDSYVLSQFPKNKRAIREYHKLKTGIDEKNLSNSEPPHKQKKELIDP